MRLPLGTALPAADGAPLLTPVTGPRGSWSATRWQYASLAGPPRARDVVCDLGGTITLSFGDQAYLLTCDGVPGLVGTVGGAYAATADALELRAHDGAPPEAVQWRLVHDTLTLSTEDARWDFDGHGQTEPARFVAVFVRL